MPGLPLSRSESMDSFHSENELQELKERFKCMDTMPWDIWELDQSLNKPYGTLGHSSLLNVNSRIHPYRNTSIICTIGPASNDINTIKKLVLAGMDIARLNLSHGTLDSHRQTIENLKEAREYFRSANPYTYNPIAIALDTKGPEIRTGLIKGCDTGAIKLTTGEKFALSLNPADEENGNQHKVYVDYPDLTKSVASCDTIYLDGGKISLKVVKVFESQVECEVEMGGVLGSRKGVNIPDKNLVKPAVSAKDLIDIEFGIEQKVDMIFASFTRKSQDIDEIRSCLGAARDKIKVIAKIENQEGVEKIDEILRVADGIMVARGDMGIEIPPEKVFLAQKMIISRCNIVGRPVICATQMLESMTECPRPTRAEVSDVANAVLDGTDGVMLSAETARGKFPVEAVEMMASIAKHAERSVPADYAEQLKMTARVLRMASEITALSCAEAALKCKAGCIIVLTRSGLSAGQLSKYRPTCPIYAVTRFTRVAQQMQLFRGVHPIFYDEPKDPEWEVDIENRVQFCLKSSVLREHVQPGSIAVVITGWRPGSGSTNSMRVITVPNYSSSK